MNAPMLIAKPSDIQRLLAYLRAGAEAVFTVTEDLRPLVMDRLKELASDHRVSVCSITPSGERLVICTGGGLLVGAGAGAWLAGFPGAIVGAFAGLFSGYACAHMSVTIRPREQRQLGFTVEIARA
ncbi:hypothetical protein [Rubrivivax sp. JA1026]|uniref:hypothetical protein n=1 Tax=Rubrivivax sp. JA1026 TaxID=2710888 RepID=UPI0013E9855F|nr:hypothetical protein [Rubrivivax sp. JA1026]